LFNDTVELLVYLIVTMGMGVGDGFMQSTVGDGLSFSLTTEFGGADLPATSQFPFGLFGNAADNENFTLDGFFAADRSGLTIPDFSGLGETDQFTASGIFGPYSNTFGDWMTLDQVPAGAFWDFDNDPETDDLLMAWYTGSEWEQRRDVVDVNGVLTPISLTGAAVKSSEFLTGLTFGAPITLGEGIIEDLANLNLNYAIDLAGYAGSSFTLRVQGVGAVPTPATLALFGLGLAGLGFSRRKKA
ncbi:MAG: choice-of-anchor F family protein, partial [Congregibacter sp.]|nr:choice-of-anchor F family protein [Congregibacter sp.]